MVALGTLLLLSLLLTAPPGLGQGPARRRRPPPPQSPLEKVAAQEELGLPQLAGRWFLVSMASRCSYLAEHSHQLEATAVTVTVPDGQSLAISTFRKLDGMCWEIKQRYLPAQAHGRFLLKGRTSRVSDAIMDKFEQRVRAVGLSEDMTYYFPTYGFCDSADEFHVLDETKP
ncbi:complement component C8 gamma chain isoform X2 [Haliaeetus albicilla]|uniref:complement component C8 gamma chain isoform X2 n=1 Tax=Haliaeetus albicilla TaxID=8969 RepID=UPI0037E8020C